MIKLLSQNLINQIAAGEVIERPSSVIKELVENSIDAGSTEIEVRIQDAGKSLISVSDNGCGMDKDSLKLCILNHATSKLSDENLFDIHTFGFRGEALPSMVSIARVSITSSDNNNGEAWKLNTEGKENLELELETRSKGTTVTVRDLFYATPARLKFLKSDTTENESCQQVLKQLSLAFRNVSFTLYDNDKKKFTYKASDNLKIRVQEIFGKEAYENLIEVNIQKGPYSLYGFIGVPTYNKTSSNYQYFFVNNRFVKDKIFSLALRSAYSGLIPPKRYPVAILFLDMPYDDVDVNAHPAKVEIRFKETELVRRFLISSLRQFVTTMCSSIPSTGIVNDMCISNNITNNQIAPSSSSNRNIQEYYASQLSNNDHRSHYSAADNNYFQSNHNNKIAKFTNSSSASNQSFSKKFNNSTSETFQFTNNFTHSNDSNIKDYDSTTPISNHSTFEPKEVQTKLNPVYSNDELNLESEPKEVQTELNPVCSNNELNLGQALYQIANTYIVAANYDSLIIVDQHAAAERITLEKLKRTTKLDSQDLLIPEVCPLSETQVELFEKHIELISKFGIVFEKLSSDVITVRALPAILGSCEPKPLINDIADELESMGDIYSLDEQIHLILSTISCHGSLRAGRKLSLEEMNSLLRQMESTDNIAQCCHGRPSFIILTNKNLRKFFERT